MSENIRSTNLRFNLEKDTQKRAWQYLQNMDKQQFKSYSNVIAVALVDYFDRYTRKHGCLYSEVFLPQYAPEEWKDRQLLWEAVESVEKTKDSRLARELVVALPSELSLDDWKSMLKRFVREQGIDLGMCADVNIHDPYPPGHNPHSHILFTMRPLDEHGKWQTKTQKEYLCKRGGEERGFTADEFKTAKTQGWEKQYMYQFGEKRQYLTPSEAEKIEGCIRTSKTPKSTRYGRQNPLTALWNSEEQIFAWRKSWEMIVNEEQERHGSILCCHPLYLLQNQIEAMDTGHSLYG